MERDNCAASKQGKAWRRRRRRHLDYAPFKGEEDNHVGFSLSAWWMPDPKTLSSQQVNKNTRDTRIERLSPPSSQKKKKNK